ncbi:MAG: DUF1592 domain-containing protein [Aureliella sp.]
MILLASQRWNCFAVLAILVLSFGFIQGGTHAQDASLLTAGKSSLAGEDVDRLRLAFELGRKRSRLSQGHRFEGEAQGLLNREQLKPDLKRFREEILPVLNEACADCHQGPEAEAHLRIEKLNPDMQVGADIAWWIEILNVVSNGEMPPADSSELNDKQREQLVDWLSREMHAASLVRRGEGDLRSFRRLTNYEYNYALQDLLGVPNQFTAKLPPENALPHGFQNSTATLTMSETQLQSYLEIGRDAIEAATAFGDCPQSRCWQITMSEAASEMQVQLDNEIDKKRRKLKDEPEKLQRELERLRNTKASSKRTHYLNLKTGDTFQTKWRYSGARYAWDSKNELDAIPEVGTHVAVIPPQQKLVVELGNEVPDRGLIRVRIRASRMPTAMDESLAEKPAGPVPSLRLEYGFQASNNSSASETISTKDVAVTAASNDPQLYEWEIPLANIAMRNPMRLTAKMGETPSPSEYIKIHNNVIPPEPGIAAEEVSVQIDYVEIEAPVNEQWPPASHRKIFADKAPQQWSRDSVEETLRLFMVRAWRGAVEAHDVNRKMRFYESLLSKDASPRQAAVEVLATVLASPRFLYVTRFADPTAAVESTPVGGAGDRVTALELASRLSLFLWCSSPDAELIRDAKSGELMNEERLRQHVARMLRDEKSRRMSLHFVRQWLALDSLDYLQVDRKLFPHFDPNLLEAIQAEPVEFFQHALESNASVFDFVHADYGLLNERLARHYHVPGVYGNQFRKVNLPPHSPRGGLLTQASMLAMNSDGEHSHPLKRGIWLLERILNDPPPPPPPSVPEIDVADPRIAEMTLKERLEDHRNDPACYSCHAKIDPWGIAFENFDAVGSWRDSIGDEPVDAKSRLFNKEELDGIEGLKAYLLRERQDQFVRAMVRKLAAFAIGRPLSFRDQAELEKIALALRARQDGLRSLVELIVCSDLFLHR